MFYSFASDQARRFELCEEERKEQTFILQCVAMGITTWESIEFINYCNSFSAAT